MFNMSGFSNFTTEKHGTLHLVSMMWELSGSRPNGLSEAKSHVCFGTGMLDIFYFCWIFAV